MGNERLSREEAHKALKILKDSHKEELLEQYNKENKRNELPDFSELYYSIEKGDLQDLALYKGHKLLFSSCTHERQHEKYL